MAPHLLPLLTLLALINLTYAQYDLTANAIFNSADSCVQSCASWVSYTAKYDLKCAVSNIPSCLCDEPSRHSPTVDQALSKCIATAPCYNPAASSIATAIFSAYCSSNGFGAVANPVANLPSPSTIPSTFTASTKAAATQPRSSSATPTSTSATSSSSSSTSNSSSASTTAPTGSLSTSDKIAIACAIGGALVSIIVAVPTWRRYKRKKAQEAVANNDTGAARSMGHGAPQQLTGAPLYGQDVPHTPWTKHDPAQMTNTNVGHPWGYSHRG